MSHKIVASTDLDAQVSWMWVDDVLVMDKALAVNTGEVLFALAFVLTATAIEGFCNGVSTGQIAHDGTANLLSAPLQILPVGNATVKEFHVWPEALPSADMAGATA